MLFDSDLLHRDPTETTNLSKQGQNRFQPLSERLRPQRFEDFVGQEHIWSQHSPLYRLVQSQRYYSLIFWGPPGVGKTTLAQLIGQSSGHHLKILSAVHASVKDLRHCFEESLRKLDTNQGCDLLFLDEVHRLSKSQQDVLLPALERGTIKFIGATTENPSFEVNGAILSRSLIFRFEALTVDAIKKLLKRALQHYDHQATWDESIFDKLAYTAAGDARRALNLLDALFHSLEESSGPRKVGAGDIAFFDEHFLSSYDKSSEAHFDCVSALIKSMRASHPDAALYYLARMIEGGEDPMFIARRLVIFASEDVGNANPTALVLAQSAMQAVHMIGYPEARILLAQAVTYLASSPKSNASYVAIDQAIDTVKKHKNQEIPYHLRNGVTPLMKKMGYGKDYQYPHDQSDQARQQSYLPASLKGKKFYRPKGIGVEKSILAWLDQNRPDKD